MPGSKATPLTVALCPLFTVSLVQADAFVILQALYPYYGKTGEPTFEFL